MREIESRSSGRAASALGCYFSSLDPVSLILTEMNTLLSWHLIKIALSQREFSYRFISLDAAEFKLDAEKHLSLIC